MKHANTKQSKTCTSEKAILPSPHSFPKVLFPQPDCRFLRTRIQMQQHWDMGKFSISPYLLLAAACPLPILLPLMSNAVRKQSGLSPFPFGCQIGEQLMNSFSLSKMVDRWRWFFSFFSFPPLSCIVQWQKGEFPPMYVWRKGMGLAALAALDWPGDEGMPLCRIPMPGG